MRLDAIRLKREEEIRAKARRDVEHNMKIQAQHAAELVAMEQERQRKVAAEQVILAKVMSTRHEVEALKYERLTSFELRRRAKVSRRILFRLN
jgi:hypothetical protein